MNNLIKWILIPFAFTYDLITSIRNFLYDRKIFKTHSSAAFVISVGNLALGGTGKTPLVIYLIGLLKNKYSVAVLSRGYKRNTKGLIIANDYLNVSAEIIGDEPMQYYRRFGNEIVVAVNEDRVAGINVIKKLYPETQIILLDDAYQHRKAGRNLNLLLTTFQRPFYNDWVVPSGRLRESRRGAIRADGVIVTKTPEVIEDSLKENILNKIKYYSQRGVPVFFSGIKYGLPIKIHGESSVVGKVIAFAGIADPVPFFQYLKLNFTVQAEFIFLDHFNYSTADLTRISTVIDKNTVIMTTEKDAVKLVSFDLNKIFGTTTIYYLPVEVTFFGQEEVFNQFIVNHQCKK